MGVPLTDDEIEFRAAQIAQSEGIQVIDLSHEQVLALARRAKLELLDENHVPGTCVLCGKPDPDIYSLVVRKKVHITCHIQIMDEFAIGPGIKIKVGKIT